MRTNPKVTLLVISVMTSGGFLFLCRSAGRFLVLDAPNQSDAIVALAGDVNDTRYYRGLRLLKDRAGSVLFVDCRIDQVEFGRTVASLEDEFIKRSAGALASRTRVCPIQGNSTNAETASVDRCLQDARSHSVLLVTSDFHTRRALSIFRRRLPQYHWSVAAARDDSIFGDKWWQRREWAKTALLEWTKLAWWECVDRWRSPP